MSVQLPPDGTGKLVEANSPDKVTQRQVVTLGDASAPGVIDSTDLVVLLQLQLLELRAIRIGMQYLVSDSGTDMDILEAASEFDHEENT